MSRIYPDAESLSEEIRIGVPEAKSVSHGYQELRRQ